MKKIFLISLISFLFSCNSENKKNADTLCNSANVSLMFYNDFTQAEIFINQAIALNPDEPRYYDVKLAILIKQHKYKEALTIYSNYNSSDLIKERITFKGMIYDKLNDKKNAFKCYNESLNLYSEALDDKKDDFNLLLNYVFLNILLDKDFNKIVQDLIIKDIPQKNIFEIKKIKNSLTKKQIINDIFKT